MQIICHIKIPCQWTCFLFYNLRLLLLACHCSVTAVDIVNMDSGFDCSQYGLICIAILCFLTDGYVKEDWLLLPWWPCIIQLSIADVDINFPIIVAMTRLVKFCKTFSFRIWSKNHIKFKVSFCTLKSKCNHLPTHQCIKVWDEQSLYEVKGFHLIWM